MSNLKRLIRPQQLRLILGGLIVLVVALVVSATQPALNFWARPHGDSLLYGKIADTRYWHDKHGQNLVANAKVTINSLPPLTTHTDEQGQFWFKGLRDISYLLKVEVPYDHSKSYSFITRVDGQTGNFFDLAADEKHNLHEIDY